VPLFGADGVQKYSRLFSSADNVELLVERIEELSEKKRE
jgi:hypothetical protein